ncbi:MAG: ribonuclease P protein component [Vulcanimicrobiota bacterium]
MFSRGEEEKVESVLLPRSMGYVTIKKPWEFSEALEKGRCISSRVLAVYLRGTDCGTARFGICVGKKLGTHVLRNLVKRRLREIVRELAHRVDSGYDVVIVARSSSRDISFSLMREQLLTLLDKAGILHGCDGDAYDTM